ncbi:MAG: efflux RND transporter periplasmic adaptor subunit, partial [Desulfobulbus sp.]
MKTLPALLILTLFFLLPVPHGQSEETSPQKDLPAAAVHVQTARETSTQPQVEMVATIQAVEQATIATKVTGTIIEFPVLLGSRVNKGDVLARISAEEISARVLQAQAQLAQAKRNLNREQKLLKRNATTKETVNSL